MNDDDITAMIGLLFTGWCWQSPWWVFRLGQPSFLLHRLPTLHSNLLATPSTLYLYLCVKYRLYIYIFLFITDYSGLSMFIPTFFLFIYTYVILIEIAILNHNFMFLLSVNHHVTFDCHLLFWSFFCSMTPPEHIAGKGTNYIHIVSAWSHCAGVFILSVIHQIWFKFKISPQFLHLKPPSIVCFYICVLCKFIPASCLKTTLGTIKLWFTFLLTVFS